MMMMMITTRSRTLRALLEVKRGQLASNGRLLFETMCWLFFHCIPKHSSLYDAMVEDGWRLLLLVDKKSNNNKFVRYWRKQELSYNWLFDRAIAALQ